MIKRKNKLIYISILVLFLSSCASSPKIVNIPTPIAYTAPKLAPEPDYPTLSSDATPAQFVHYCVYTIKLCKLDNKTIRHQVKD